MSVPLDLKVDRAVRQQYRLVALVVYGVLLMGLSQLLFGTPLPATDIRGVFVFYFAFAALLLGEYLVEPFFSRPADAVANSATLFIAVATATATGAAVTTETFVLGQRILAAYAVVVGSLAVLAIGGKDAGGRWQTSARIATGFVAVAGRAKWMFSIAFFASVWAAFADRPSVIAVLYLSWFIIVAVRPVEWLLQRLRRTSRGRTEDAELLRIQDPAIAVLRLPRGSSPRLGDRLTLDGHVEGTVVDVTESADRPVVRLSLDKRSGFPRRFLTWDLLRHLAPKSSDTSTRALTLRPFASAPFRLRLTLEWRRDAFWLWTSEIPPPSIR